VTAISNNGVLPPPSTHKPLPRCRCVPVPDRSPKPEQSQPDASVGDTLTRHRAEFERTVHAAHQSACRFPMMGALTGGLDWTQYNRLDSIERIALAYIEQRTGLAGADAWPVDLADMARVLSYGQSFTLRPGDCAAIIMQLDRAGCLDYTFTWGDGRGARALIGLSGRCDAFAAAAEFLGAGFRSRQWSHAVVSMIG